MPRQLKIMLLIGAMVTSLINPRPAFCAETNRTLPLAINEFMASNGSSTRDPQGQCDDWIEIYNYSSAAIDIGGKYLTDNLSSPTKWRVPSNDPGATTIGPRGYILIWADDDTNDAGLHASFKLDGGGEEIGLFDGDGNTLIDSVTFGAQTGEVSCGRLPDGSEQWQLFAQPSPGTTNVGLYDGFVSKVEFSHERGFYDAPFSVTLATETAGATIYYTLDGSEPYEMAGRSATGRVYVGPIYVSGTTCLRVKAIKSGWRPADAQAQTYIFPADVITQTQQQALSAGYPTSWSGYPGDYEMDPQICTDPDYAHLMEEALLSIPTVSITTDKDNLFDPSRGIYANPTRKGAEWERPASAEFFNRDGSKQFQINCGLRLQGGAARQPYKCP
ncbi:MAG: lamin tail domain-containing protein, partial [Planctomycetota bacterium]